MWLVSVWTSLFGHNWGHTDQWFVGDITIYHPQCHMQVIVSPLVPDQDPINITTKYFCQSKRKNQEVKSNTTHQISYSGILGYFIRNFSSNWCNVISCLNLFISLWRFVTVLTIVLSGSWSGTKDDIQWYLPMHEIYLPCPSLLEFVRYNPLRRNCIVKSTITRIHMIKYKGIRRI